MRASVAFETPAEIGEDAFTELPAISTLGRRCPVGMIQIGIALCEKSVKSRNDKTHKNTQNDENSFKMYVFYIPRRLHSFCAEKWVRTWICAKIID